MKKHGRCLAFILGITSMGVVILGGIFLGVIAVAIGFLIGIIGIIVYNKADHKGTLKKNIPMPDIADMALHTCMAIQVRIFLTIQ